MKQEQDEIRACFTPLCAFGLLRVGWIVDRSFIIRVWSFVSWLAFLRFAERIWLRSRCPSALLTLMCHVPDVVDCCWTPEHGCATMWQHPPRIFALFFVLYKEARAKIGGLFLSLLVLLSQFLPGTPAFRGEKCAFPQSSLGGGTAAMSLWFDRRGTVCWAGEEIAG